MTNLFLEKKFNALGARLKVEEAPSTGFSIDVQHDGDGEFFKIVKSPEQDIENVVVVDLRPVERHMLLLVKHDDRKRKFLCGHNQRHWYVAAVPEIMSVTNVDTAVEALEPREARNSKMRQQNVNDNQRLERKTRAFRRQGEWFFIPAPTLKVSAAWVRLNEPLRRDVGCKPHIMQFCVRLKGETVYVCDRYPNGLREVEYQRVLDSVTAARSWNWEVRQRAGRVYAKGRVRHPEHKTITLTGWHRVLNNIESEAHGVSISDQ